MNTKITVIVPVYNVEPYLKQCLDSIIGQTHSDLEILCVNDGSTDASAEVLEAYARSDPRVRVITQENAGASAARNAALAGASGDYILFVDGDDWIEETTCEIALNAAQASGADVVMWSYVRELPGQSRPKNIMDQDRIYEGDAVKDQLHRRMVGIVGEELSHPENADALCTIWGKLYRRDLIEANSIRFFDIRKIGTFEDGLFNLEVFANAHKAVFLNRHLYHYRKDNAASITTAYNPRLRGQWEMLFAVMEAYLGETPRESAYTEAFANRIVLSLIPLGINEMGSPGGIREKLSGIRGIIHTERYRKAIASFRFACLPIHWKVFFICARLRCSFGVYLLLLLIQMIRGRL